MDLSYSNNSFIILSDVSVAAANLLHSGVSAEASSSELRKCRIAVSYLREITYCHLFFFLKKTFVVSHLEHISNALSEETLVPRRN